jgi:hypothetical protein
VPALKSSVLKSGFIAKILKNGTFYGNIERFGNYRYKSPCPLYQYI